VLPLAHQSPQPKWQIDHFGCFCTAHSRKSLYFSIWAPLSPKIAPSHGGSGPYLTHDSWGPSKPTHNPNSIWIDSVIFCTDDCSAECHDTLQRNAPFPSKLPLSTRDLDPHLIPGSLGPSTQTAPRSVEPFLHSSLVSVSQTDGHTTLFFQ